METREDRNSRITYSESCGSARGGLSTSNGGKWPETRRDRQDYGKKRERSRDVNGSDRTYHGKGARLWQGSRDRYEEPSQQSPQQPVPYFNNRDHSYIANRHISVPQYSINHSWSVNPMDGMAISANMTINQPSTAVPSVSGMEMTQTNNPAMNPYAYASGMPGGGGNMYGMMGSFGQFGMGNSHHMVGHNEVIPLTRCVLFRNPNTPPHAPRTKPFSSKTLRVWGLPSKVTEEILKEAFERYGTILKIQMISKTSYLIRFESEDLMDNAFYLAGYQMTIEGKSDHDHNGFVYVDYAKDDNVECQQALDLEDNLQLRGPTRSPSLVHYTEEEAEKQKEKLKKEETFQQALVVLMSWLENGECNKKTVSTFYSMIQIAHTHVRGLMNSKLKYEEEVNKAKSVLTKQVETTLTEFQKIEKVFGTASLQKVWDHFTKAQRKHIEEWKKQIEEAQHDHLNELLKDRVEDEMEVSEDEETKTADASEEQKNKVKKKYNLLKEEQDTLKRRLEKLEKEHSTYKSLVAIQLSRKEQHMQVLKQAAQNAEKQLLNYNCKRNKDTNENQTTNDHCATATINTADTSARHATLISLISTFLTVHPFGASIDYIFSYLYQIDKTIDLRYVENLLRCYPMVFSEVSLGVGATLEKKWKYLGFQI